MPDEEKPTPVETEPPADEPIELLPDPTQKPKPDPKPDDAEAARKQESSLAYQLRKEKERATQLESDNRKYKDREEAERQAKLTAEEKRDEELAAVREERDRLKRENLITQIGIDAKLPKSMWPRIQGADEDAMRADAEELAKLVKRPAIGSATDPVREGGTKPRQITRAEMQASPKLAREAAEKLRTGEWVLAVG